jgi:hypothetical protein
MKAGIEWCAALFCDSFRLVLKYFFNSPTISTYESRDWVMCCSLWFLSLRLVLEYFSTVLPISTYESRDWVMCCSFVIPFFTFGLKKFFNSPTILPMAELSDVLLFCDSFLYVLVLRVFFKAVPLVSTVRYFQQSYKFYLKQELSDVLLFCDSFLYVWS